MLHRLLPTLLERRNTIVCARSRMNFTNSSSAMACAGGVRKPLKRLSLRVVRSITGLKASVNKSGSEGRYRQTCARVGENHFFIRSSTAAVIATIPVRIVGSGTGANLLECKLGSGDAPGFFDSAIFAGSTAPT